MSRYRSRGDGYGSEVLDNGHVRCVVHRRATGWGWAQLSAQDGSPVAVLEHLGEVAVSPGVPPARLESAEVRREEVNGTQRLVFDVSDVVARHRLAGTSFAQWVGYPLDQPLLNGTVTIELDPDRPALRLSWNLRSLADVSVRYLRGPWLRVGEGEGGTGPARDDALLPGVDWAVGDEWTSGSDSFRDPWALRSAPHPHKVSAPVMAVAAGGWAVGLSWDPAQQVTGWFNQRRHVPQPVLASPNFVDRMPHHLMGVMLPSAERESDENAVAVTSSGPGLELHLHQSVDLDAEVVVLPGRSLDVLVDHVRRRGMPRPTWRWQPDDALDRIAGAYATSLWHHGRGFGVHQREDDVSPRVPRFLERYLARRPDGDHSAGLRDAAAWCRAQDVADPSERGGSVDDLLAAQREDGTFGFEPDGRHYAKDDVLVARDLVDPMGQAGDTALDLCALPALQLLAEYERTGDGRLADAARRALDACARWDRPEGGDYWETPLHAPNLLAAGHAAVAHEMGYRLLGQQRYADRAVHWIRCLLPFTHLWEPATTPMLYDTKPCLCSSDWYFANWVRDHVQWEVLEVFALSSDQGIDWAAVDPELDWAMYQEGVTAAGVRWLLDHREDRWMPHNLPQSRERYAAGGFDMCLPDTHNSVTGLHGGMAIAPDVVALNLLAVLERRETTARARLSDPS